MKLTTYRIHRINVILIFISQGFDTFDSVLTPKQLIETLDFTVSNFLAFCTQI